MDLNKGDGENQVLWLTEDYCVLPREGYKGYYVINRNTGQAEIKIDQEPSAVMAMLWLQDMYDEIMQDPAAHYQERKEMLASAFIIGEESSSGGFSVN